MTFVVDDVDDVDDADDVDDVDEKLMTTFHSSKGISMRRAEKILFKRCQLLAIFNKIRVKRTCVEHRSLSGEFG